MSLILLFAMSAGQLGGSAEDTPSTRAFQEISDEMHDLLRAEATARTQEERAEAVKGICRLYSEIMADPRLEDSDTLKSYKGKLWSRMTRVRDRLERELDREADSARRRYAPEELAALEQAGVQLASQINQIHATMGGPAYFFDQTGGAFGGGMVMDHSQELIDLIQRTIKPDHWDVNGGPGSIMYYRPVMALVISATSEIHNDIGGLMQAMRRAGM